MANVLRFRPIETIQPDGVDRLLAKKAPLGVSIGDQHAEREADPAGAFSGDCGQVWPPAIPFVFSVAAMMVSLTDGDHHRAAFSPPPFIPAKCPEQDLNLQRANEPGDERKTRQITGDFNISDGGGDEKSGAKKYFHNSDFSVDDISDMGAGGGILPLLGRFQDANRLSACERVCRANRSAVHRDDPAVYARGQRLRRRDRKAVVHIFLFFACVLRSLRYNIHRSTMIEATARLREAGKKLREYESWRNPFTTLPHCPLTNRRE